MGYPFCFFVYTYEVKQNRQKKWTRFRVQNIIYILKRGSCDKFNLRLLEFDNRYISFV
ncbi:hypothetical protein PVOR_29339 [Paenibacillus vortex V453]|uniref:Uncharacterized protein n=1 Tax=Paenibacillus vortex V453 TaxID=715225 RepID=A0A2R9SMV7_9BACL|nr:hypothetical protein PVOR_29339 [Paenibacillus vortex V453]MDH6673455.1 hypothetical protein [Paenibacillus sp. LBL]